MHFVWWVLSWFQWKQIRAYSLRSNDEPFIWKKLKNFCLTKIKLRKNPPEHKSKLQVVKQPWETPVDYLTCNKWLWIIWIFLFKSLSQTVCKVQGCKVVCVFEQTVLQTNLGKQINICFLARLKKGGWWVSSLPCCEFYPPWNFLFLVPPFFLPFETTDSLKELFLFILCNRRSARVA